MCGAIPPRPTTPSWHGAQLKSTGKTLPLPLEIYCYKTNHTTNAMLVGVTIYSALYS